jgi:ABC-2 type transport system ATP-binding protein/lipopolysaccharide transport system ATP-binding protein
MIGFKRINCENKKMKQKKSSKKNLRKIPELSIQVIDVTKRYQLHHEKPTFAEQIIRKRQNEIYTALDKVNLTIYKGERVGIMGPNGSGKTTLLKIIAGITTPNEGNIITHGKVVSLIDIGAGFHPELTGEENIFLNGLVLGMSKQDIKKKYSAIVKFADIGKFIDAPMYTYSTGMKLRLGFSIAIYTDPDILLLDEGIVVGDENFQKKIEKFMYSFFKKNKTIIIVSHWKEFLDKNCSRIVDLHSLSNKK